MPSATTNRKINYLTRWMFHFYEKITPNNRGRDNLFSPQWQATKPCADLLASESTASDEDKINGILDYLNTHCQANATMENTNKFWYEVFDWVDAHESFMKEHNGRRLMEVMTNKCGDLGYWNNELSNMFVSLYNRGKKLPDNGVDATPEVQAELDRTWESMVGVINAKKALLPARPKYWRFDRDGVYCETTDKEWHIVGGCGGNVTPSSEGNERESNRLKKIQNFWFDKAKGQYKYGLEFEFCLPEKNKDKFFESCAKAGLCDNNFISAGTDPTVEVLDGDHDRDDYYLGLEITTMPATYSEAIEKWSLLGKIAKENGGVFGESANAGGHIHVDKPNSKWEQIAIVNHFIKMENLGDFFGRGSKTSNEFRDTYGNYIGTEVKEERSEYGSHPNGEVWKKVDGCIKWHETLIIDKELTDKLHSEKKLPDDKVIGSADIDIQATGRGILNFNNKNTIEFRGFNSISNPERNLEVLAKELQKVLGDRVYDKTPISKVQQQENEKSNIDFLGDALKSLGYNDNQVKLAQGLKFEQNLEPTEMITQSIRMLENQVNNQQQGQVHLMSSSTNRSR